MHSAVLKCDRHGQNAPWFFPVKQLSQKNRLQGVQTWPQTILVWREGWISGKWCHPGLGWTAASWLWFKAEVLVTKDFYFIQAVMVLNGCVNIETSLAEKFTQETTRQPDSCCPPFTDTFSDFLYFEIIHETEPIHRIVTSIIIKGFIKVSDCTVFHKFMNSHHKSSAYINKRVKRFKKNILAAVVRKLNNVIYWI